MARRGALCAMMPRSCAYLQVKFAYPRVVDYGQNNRHSPDGKLYFTSYGSSRADGPVSWMSGDEAHMARTDPSAGPLSINNVTSYEFYAGDFKPDKTITRLSR
jgi:hypothetical protein